MKKITFLSIIIFLFACDNNNSNSSLPTTLASNIGGSDELMIVINDDFATDELIKDIKKNMVDYYKILPQSQARFLISTVRFSKVNYLLKRFINQIYVVTKNEKSELSKLISEILSEEEKEQLQNGKSIFYKKNIWSRNQSIVIIVAENEEDILNRLLKHKNEINRYFDDTNLKFYKKIAFIDGVNQTLKSQLKEYHNIDLDIPNGYVLAENKDNYILLRKEIDKVTLFLAFDLTNYNDTISLNNLGIEKFNELGQFINGEKPESYVVADTTLGFELEKTQKGRLTIFENGGLWLMENDYVGGGPFINQYIIDNYNNRVIYLSGMIYGPQERKKKKYMRQFEAIFNTLKIH